VTTTTRPRPAHHCPNATHTLQWGLHPRSNTQGWILRRQHTDGATTPVGLLDGYPPGRPPVTTREAREWADAQLGAPQAWVEQPTRSSAFHAHGLTGTPKGSPGL
jgi:hypothetical protein